MTRLGCRVAVWAMGLAMVCAGVYAPLASAQGADEERATAERFFEGMTRSSNAHIARVGREYLEKLRHGGVSDGDSRVTVSVPVITQTPMGVMVTSMLNGRAIGAFLVDTGASYTVISPRMAAKLGLVALSDAPRVTIQTANGPISAPKARLESLTLGGVEVRNVEVVVQSLGDDPLLAGLLGMNAFQGMEVAITASGLKITSAPVVDASTTSRLSQR